MSNKEHECACTEHAEGDVIICRCEEVYLSELKKAIEAGSYSFAEVRILTRAGMGLCQGRTCGRLARAVYARETGISIEQVEPATVRAPVRPVPLSAIGAGVAAEEFQDDNNPEGREAPAYVNQVFKDAYEGEGPAIV